MLLAVISESVFDEHVLGCLSTFILPYNPDLAQTQDFPRKSGTNMDHGVPPHLAAFSVEHRYDYGKSVKKHKSLPFTLLHDTESDFKYSSPIIKNNISRQTLSASEDLDTFKGE